MASRILFFLLWVFVFNTNTPAAAPPSETENLPVVAVAEVTFSHAAAKLVFATDTVRDVITRQLHRTGRLKAIDWSRLNAVMFRRNLEWSDVVEDESDRKAVQDVLLNDYFLTGGISSYGERWEFNASAFSKSKTQIARVQVELFLKDALTNEIKVSASGVAEKQRTVSQSLGFGASGGSDPTLANDALNEAVESAIANLLVGLTAQTTPGTRKENPDEKN